MQYKTPLSLLFLFCFLSAVSVWGQMGRMSGQAMPASSDLNGNSATFIQGSVTSEDGVLPSQIVIVLNCAGQSYTKTFADANGDFSFQVGNTAQDMVPMAESGASASMPFPQASSNMGMCSLEAEASGYTSSHIQLAGLPASGMVNAGKIILHPLTKGSAGVPGSGKGMINISQMNIPSKAKDEFARGMREEQSHNAKKAETHFRRAINVFPNYALAWCELGRVQEQAGRANDAYASYQHALEADPNLVNAARGLSILQAHKQQWQALLDTTNHILQTYPNQYSEFWFLNSVAYFNLQNLQGAERSVLRGLRLDSKHQIPQLEYLCGRVLGAQGHYQDAAAHIRNYLRLAPKAPDAHQAAEFLAAFEKSTNIAAAGK